MPEFVLQLEQMSGLPAWSLLLIAALVLLVFALAVSLAQAKRRSAAVALQDNLNTLRKDVPDAVDPLDAGEMPTVADTPEGKQAADASEAVPAVAPADEPMDGPAAYEPDEPASERIEEGPESKEAADEAVDDELADELAEDDPDEPAEEEPDEGEPADSAEEPEEPADEQPGEEPESEEPVDEGFGELEESEFDEPEEHEELDEPEDSLFASEADVADNLPEFADEENEPVKANGHSAWKVEEPQPAAAAWDVDDHEIAKAVAGGHGRVGQSPFGIDFGFLEEYEEQYETALNEFQRLREKYRS